MKEAKLVRNERELEALVEGEVVMIGNCSDSPDFARIPFVYAGKYEIEGTVYFNFVHRDQGIEGILEFTGEKNVFTYTAEGLSLNDTYRAFHVLYRGGNLIPELHEIEKQDYDVKAKLLIEAGL